MKPIACRAAWPNVDLLHFSRAAGCIALLAALSMGCARYDVSYDLAGVPDLSAGPLSGYAVSVQPLEDARDPARIALRGSPVAAATVKRSGETWYSLSDDLYEEQVADAITKAVAAHLAAARIFRSVVIADDGSGADLILSGRIERFDSIRKQRSWAEAVVAQGGLVGLVGGLMARTPYEAVTILHF